MQDQALEQEIPVCISSAGSTEIRKRLRHAGRLSRAMVAGMRKESRLGSKTPNIVGKRENTANAAHSINQREYDI